MYYNQWAEFADFGIDFEPEYYTSGFGIKPPRHVNQIKNLSDIKTNSVLFVKQDILCASDSILESLEAEKKRVVLISGISSLSHPNPMRISHSHSVAKWFTSNPLFIHPKIYPLPIGFEEIDRHDSSFFNYEALEQSKVNKSLVCSFSYHNNDYHSSRKGEINTMGLGKLKMSDKMKYSEYQSLLFDSYSTICMRGAGYDTHRVYESLASSCIPVIDNMIVAGVLAFNYLPFIFMDELCQSKKPQDLVENKWYSVNWLDVKRRLTHRYYMKIVNDARAQLIGL
jgi:hypothetical protein